MIETLVLSAASFAGTNIDDLLINAIFFSEAEAKSDYKSIVCGKYLGIGALVFFSILGALGFQFLPQQNIGYLGFVPVCIGLKEMIASMKPKEKNAYAENTEKPARKIIDTALITMANGADNIGVYIPLFAGFSARQIAWTVFVFIILTAIWCFIGKSLADLPVLKNLFARYKAVIVPAVYIALGAYILKKNFL